MTKHNQSYVKRFQRHFVGIKLATILFQKINVTIRKSEVQLCLTMSDEEVV